MANAVTLLRSVSSMTIPGGGVAQLYQVFSNELVNAAVNVDSIVNPSVLGAPLGEYRSFGCWVKMTGTPDIDIQILQSFDDTSANYAVPDSFGTIGTVTDTSIHLFPVSPVAMLNWRIRLKGNAGNGATTRVDLYLFCQT